MKPARNSASIACSRADLAMAVDQRIGVRRLAVAQQAAGQQVRARPRRRAAAPAGRADRAAPPRRGRHSASASAVRSARRSQRAWSSISPGSSARSAAGSGGDQRLGVRIVALQRQPRLGRRAVRRVEPARSAAPRRPGRARPGAGSAPIGRPASRRRPSGAGTRPPAPVGEAGDPGAARLGGGLGVAAGVGQGVGAAQQGRRLGDRRGGALRQHGGVVRVGGDRLLAAALQQRLVRPVRAVRA